MRTELKDDVYLNIASEIARLATCQFTQVGAVLLNEKGSVVCATYNGTPSGCPHCTEFEMTRDEHLQFATDFEIHAEMNAMLRSSTEDTRNSTIYTTISPCNNCLKHMAEKGVNRIVTRAIYWRSTEEEVTQSCARYGISFTLINKD